jgi:hypothetical protein
MAAFFVAFKFSLLGPPQCFGTATFRREGTGRSGGGRRLQGLCSAAFEASRGFAAVWELFSSKRLSRPMAATRHSGVIKVTDIFLAALHVYCS